MTSRIIMALLITLLVLSPLLSFSSRGEASIRDLQVGPVSGSWSNVTQGQGPPRLAGQGMVFAASISRFLMFGGQVPTYATESSVWSFDPVSAAWSPVRVSGPTPQGRADPIMALIPGISGGESVFLFGGWYNTTGGSVGRLNDTWLFSPTNSTWARIQTAAAPLARSDSAVAYDNRANEVLIYGGYNGSYLSDAWTFSMANLSWSKVIPVSSTNPPPLADARMGFDSADGVLVMFGGNNGLDTAQGFNHYDTTWTFDLSTRVWSDASPARSPSARDYPFFSYDPSDDVFILFGGYGQRVPLSDTWTYSYPSNQWEKAMLASSPPGRYAGGGAYDPSTRTFLIYGGVHGETYLDDTWLLRLGSPTTASPLLWPSIAFLLVLMVTVSTFLWTRARSARGTGDRQRTILRASVCRTSNRTP